MGSRYTHALCNHTFSTCPYPRYFGQTTFTRCRGIYLARSCTVIFPSLDYKRHVEYNYHWCWLYRSGQLAWFSHLQINMSDNILLSDISKVEIASIKSPSVFMQEIDKLVEEEGLEYIEAIIYYCEVNDIEIETAASLIKGSAKMKAKVQLEAENLNYIPKSGKLPI